MKILLDMDGVIADFILALCGVIGVRNPYYRDAEKGDHMWDFSNAFGLDSEEQNELWDLLDERFWANIPQTKEAGDLIELLERSFGKENICLLTSPCLTKGCFDGKLAWIDKNFPQFSRRYLVGPAKTFCAHSGSILIDDRTENCTEFADAGGTSFLVPRPWNLRWPGEGDWMSRLEEWILGGCLSR